MREIRDERLALLQASIIFARRGRVDRARRYLSIFASLPPMEPMMAFAHDRRLDALRSHAEGVVARAAGDVPLALDRLGDAYGVFVKIGYAWHSALCALDMHEITQEEEWRNRAIEHVSAYPYSWLAVRIKGVGASLDPRYTTLTPVEKRIFQMLIANYGRREISDRTGTQISSVNTHVSRVFAKWNVHSQRELIAEVQRVR